MVTTRSGAQVNPVERPKTAYCHQSRHYDALEGGLFCGTCNRFWCASHLNLYPPRTWSGPVFECFYCLGNCKCSMCVKHSPLLKTKKRKLGRKKMKEDKVIDDCGVFQIGQKMEKQFSVAELNDLSRRIEVIKEYHSEIAAQARRFIDTSHTTDLNNMVVAVQALAAQHEDLKVKYNEEQEMRRKLYSQLLDAKGSIRVFCRCRPLNETESLRGSSTVLFFDSSSNGEIEVLDRRSTKKTFLFDKVFTPTDNQADVFAQASPLVTSVLDGYNVCIFAYGQTATGKTFTMEGPEGNRGINYRMLVELFDMAQERAASCTYTISVSVIEVYNDEIRDLLAKPSSSTKKSGVKKISERLDIIPEFIEEKVKNTEEAWNALRVGSSARAVGSTDMNEHSSRSHCMIRIVVKATSLLNGECTRSKLWLIDLAGSERLGKSHAVGDRLTEAQHINRSLSALGDVMFALATKTSHIPYRNSRLTRILQDSLGGESKTLMFVNVSPSEDDLSETLSSLNFASRVRGVELGPARKQIQKSAIQKKNMLDIATPQTAVSKLKAKHTTIGKDQMKQAEKIKALEKKLLERVQKIEELENKLIERDRKIEELGKKLKEQEQNSDSTSLCLKINELEGKPKDQERRQLNRSKINDSVGSIGVGEGRRHRMWTEIENVENNNENKSRKSDRQRGPTSG